MRIALFSGNYNYLREGANQALNRLVRFLEEECGHRVRVYSPVTGTPAFEPAGTLVPVPSVPLPIRGEFRLALRLPRAVKRDVERFAPDIVHVSTPDVLGTRAQTFAKRLGVPVVASLHTLFETYLEHYGLGGVRPMLEAHLRRFYRRSDYVLVPTQALLEEMIAMREDDRVSIWSRGIDRALFSPARRDPRWRSERGWSDDDIVILFFGRLVAEKGIDIFVSVLRALQDRGLEARPLIVGAGPAVNALRSLSGAVLTGHLDNLELAKAVASADIMLHPSTTETFGNVVLEGMASGLALIGADAPSTRALIRDGETGMLCPPRNIAAYTAAATALIASPEQRRRLAAAARAASASYSWDAASRSVEEAYLRVLTHAARNHSR